MDKRVGNQLADGGFGIHGDFLAERLTDDLVPREEGIHELDQSLEAASVALVTNLLANSFQPPFSFIDNDPEGFPVEASERIQTLGEQNRPEVSDVPLTRLIGYDHPIFL